MTAKDREKLSLLVERAMRTIQVADDQLEDGNGDPQMVRDLVKQCRDRCTEALALLPSENGT